MSEFQLRPDGTSCGARISECGRYRYNLWRVWNDIYPVVTWIMCNPSTADASVDDPTIRKCIGFAKRWGYGGIVVVNVCALRATDPRALLDVPDPFGPENEQELRSALANRRQFCVAAWGDALPISMRSRGRRILSLLPAAEAHLGVACLGTTKSGQPRHPLMLPYATELQSWGAV